MRTPAGAPLSEIDRVGGASDMLSDNDWDIINNERGSRVKEVGTGALRVALLFGSAFAALALFLTPILQHQARMAQNSYPYGLDPTMTGAVSMASGIYTIQRSVLQRSPDSVCIIRGNGERVGDC